MTDSRLRVVLDTNVLIASLGRRSPYRWVFDAVLEEDLGLILSEPIIQEYRAVIARKTTESIAENVINALLFLPSCKRTPPSFRWNLIQGDPDDNKFVDVAISGGADAIVTQDSHFNVLSTIEFPPLSIWNLPTLEEHLSPHSDA